MNNFISSKDGHTFENYRNEPKSGDTNSTDRTGAVDPEIQRLLLSYGHHIDSYRSKYTTNGDKNDNSNVLINTNYLSSADAIMKNNEQSDQRLQTCTVCKGFGLVKEIYNHIVHERNCDNCETEGIMWWSENDGVFVPLSQRKL